MAPCPSASLTYVVLRAPSSQPPQTTQTPPQACRADLEKSQEECTDLDMRAMQAEGQSAALRQEVVGLKEQADAWREERSMLSTQLAELEDALRAAQVRGWPTLGARGPSGPADCGVGVRGG